MASFISKASFWVPEMLVPSGWIEHAPFAFWLMDAHRPDLVVELGTHSGYSYFAFNQAARSLGLKTRFFAIDTWRGDEHSGLYDNKIFEAVKHHNDNNYWNYSELIRSTFNEAVASFADNSIDLLHIDGRHYYRDVRQTFETWKPKLSSRGVVLFHDTNVRVKDFGVFKFWNQIKEEYQHFEFFQGYGLGVAAIGPGVTGELVRLFEASSEPATAEYIRHVYGRLGTAIKDRFELVEAQKAVTNQELADKIQSVTAERDQIWLQKQVAEASLKEFEHSAAMAKSELDESRQLASSLEAEIRNSQAHLADLRTELLDRDAEAMRNLSEMQGKKAEIVNARVDLSRVEAELKRTSSELVRSQLSVEVIQADLSREREERDRHQAASRIRIAEQERLRTELSSTTADLARVHASVSWRITYPLRRMEGKILHIKDLLKRPARTAWWGVTRQLPQRRRLTKESEFLVACTLFDNQYYLERNPDVCRAGIQPGEHYLTQGAAEGRNPQALFDTRWYLEQYPDVEASGANALSHYAQHGWREGRNPHPLFDTRWYLTQNPDVANSGLNPLVHYGNFGWKEKRDPHPLFHQAFYLENYPEVARLGIDPLIDYLRRGAAEKLNPHPFFDSGWYLEQHPDVAASGANPLVHYLERGWKEGRDPHPVFDTSFYVSRYSDVGASGINPLLHYVTNGLTERRSPHRWYGQNTPSVLPTVVGKDEWEAYGRNRLAALLSGDQDLIFPSLENPEISVVLVFHNKAYLSAVCLDALLHSHNLNFEVLIVDNASTDETDSLLRRCKGAKIIRNQKNQGFGAACMQGGSEAAGRYLLFLNNDTLVEPDAIEAALAQFPDPSLGAVGGKILLATGELQEAGSIIWSDGFTHGYGRLDTPTRPEYEFRRPVDYCSGAFLLTPRDVFHRLGGFDEVYAPAYYEDADYCMKLWEAGLKVIYDPSCVIRHFENATSGGVENVATGALVASNRQSFVSRWDRQLKVHYPRSVENITKARIASQAPGLRILYIDDLVPHRALGCGYPRSNDIIHQLRDAGDFVTFAGMFATLQPLDLEYADISRDIELIDAKQEQERLFRDYVPNSDVIWVSRPHTLCAFLDRLTQLGGVLPKLVYDAEAIFNDRDRLFAKLHNRVVPPKVFDVQLWREVALVRAADAVVVVSPKDKLTLEREGVTNIHILSHCVAPAPTPASFSQRRSLLFVGAMHTWENPNADSIRYFCQEIWPEVRRRTDAELVICGFGTDRFLDEFKQERVHIQGSVQDLTPVYDQARAFFAPTRYSAGIPLKVYEAAAHGVPSVVSKLIGQQLGWKHGHDVLVAEDTASFVDLCCELFSDEKLWAELRRNALIRVSTQCSPAQSKEKISAILDSVLNNTGSAAGAGQ